MDIPVPASKSSRVQEAALASLVDVLEAARPHRLPVEAQVGLLEQLAGVLQAQHPHPHQVPTPTPEPCKFISNHVIYNHTQIYTQ